MLNEADTKAKLIDPKLHKAGWTENLISREYYLTDGRISIRGDKHKREKRKWADYILRYINSFPIAIVEAKDESHSSLDGIQQAKGYAEMLKIKFAYSTNGHGIEEFDFITNKQKSLDRFPKPEELWNRYINWKKEEFAEIVAYEKESYGISKEDYYKNPLFYPYYYELEGKKPRYYQETSIHKVIEAILEGKKKILLAMATGTGKTYIAFQITWKLVKSSHFKKILYITDRIFLRDQAHNNEFYPFGNARAIIKEGKAPKTRDIYFSMYQSLYSEQEDKRLYQEYPSDFFDLIIIDECHRSGFGTWNEILKHFKDAVQIGMTATPKRDDNIDTYAYFGEPVYSYSMGQGIEDGFLAPFHIHRILTSVDKEGLHLDEARYQGAQIYIPEEADVKEFYTMEDFEREIILPDRTSQICEHLANLLRNFGAMQKTIIFCVTMDHAAEVSKELQNQFFDLGYSDYSVRIVSEEPEVKAIYEKFQDSDKPVPVIATTVDLLTTGVDVPSVQNIVIIKPISSKVVFKQIVGRGCRIDPNTNKYFFRIIDYVNATRLLDSWDYPKAGELGRLIEGPFDLSISGVVINSKTQIPIPEISVIAQIGPNMQRRIITNSKGYFNLTKLPHSAIALYVRGKGFKSKQMTITPIPDMPPIVIELKEEVPIIQKILIKGIEVHIAEETRIFFTEDGRTFNEAEYIEYSKNGFVKRVTSLEQLREIWIDWNKRNIFIEALKVKSIFPTLIASILKKPDADTFDILAHIAFDVPIITRDERAKAFLNKHQKLMNLFNPDAREVLLKLLDKYRVGGINEIRPEIFRIPPFDKMGYMPGIIKRFKNTKILNYAMKELQRRIYA